jgi:primosomal protein N'
MLTPASRRSKEVTSYLRLQHFQLSDAFLCQDCNAIGNSAQQCPACASEVLMNLAVVLNRADDVPGNVFSSLPTFAAGSSMQGSALAA